MDSFELSFFVSIAIGFVNCFWIRRKIKHTELTLEVGKKTFKLISLFTVIFCTFFLYFALVEILEIFGVASDFAHGAAFAGSIGINLLLSLVSSFFGYYLIDWSLSSLNL